MTDKPYQTLSSKMIYRNNWFSLRQDEIKLPDQSDGTYTIIQRPGAAWIVPVLDDGRIVLIRNYRYTIDRWLWEIPAGSLDAVHSPLENARRELKEEIGGEADSFELMATMYTMPGISDEIGYYFLAQGVKLGQTHHEPSEVMERHIFPLQTVMTMAAAGEIEDGPSTLALLMSFPRLTLENQR